MFFKSLQEEEFKRLRKTYFKRNIKTNNKNYFWQIVIIIIGLVCSNNIQNIVISSAILYGTVFYATSVYVDILLEKVKSRLIRFIAVIALIFSSLVLSLSIYQNANLSVGVIIALIVSFFNTGKKEKE